MSTSHLRRAFVVLSFCCLAPMASAEIAVAPVFGGHMVLQRGVEVPVWGSGKAGEKVVVEFAGKRVTDEVDEKGLWSVKLPAMEPLGEAAVMTVSGDATDKPIVFEDVLVGDVWICSGQSNMQWSVKQSKDAEAEIEGAKHPNIRIFRVPNVTATQPTKALKGKWEVCTPATVGDSSAVGYFFGRDVARSQGVPIGLIQNAWGGMPVESFTSESALKGDPDFAPVLERKRQPSTQDAKRVKASYEKASAAWDAKYLRQDEANRGEEQGWQKPDIDLSGWKSMDLPKHWEDDGLKIDGAVWFRRDVEIPAEWSGKKLSLGLGGIDDTDTAYFNGVEVGKTQHELAVMVQRYYTVPAELVNPGKATIAVRVFDKFSGGGFYGPPVAMKLTVKDDDSVKPMKLTGNWLFKIEKEYPQPDNVPPRPAAPVAANAPQLASNIYNAMVYPLVPYAIKGAIWYQGESNAGRAEQYRKLFPAMIADWRKQWGSEFPFLFVQLANFGNGRPTPDQPTDSTWAELREAQTMTLVASPRTGMAVIIDIGDHKDIHPKNKQDVGKRLALAAEKVAYGKPGVEYSGPIYQVLKIEGDKARIMFDHAKGLKTKDGSAPKGFQIAGADKKWVWADAKIQGQDVIVWSEQVKAPVAVRYGWADDPVTSLYNGVDLPLSPFRTDDWEMITAGKK